jgi:ubiquitin-like protein Pup
MAQPTSRAKADVRTTKPAEHEDEKPSVARTQLTKRGEELAEKLDDLLDEIDEVLEENTEEFVKGYVQRGGE